MNDYDVWILVDKNGIHYSHKQGVITMFKSKFKAVMFANYELNKDDLWTLHEVVVDEELFKDSYVNFV
tara:strand:- start:46 stop:249 length:204 start_codon:yes stop_codon:yes gene_type:complete